MVRCTKRFIRKNLPPMFWFFYNGIANFPQCFCGRMPNPHPMGWLPKQWGMAGDMCKMFPGDRTELADFVDYVVGGWSSIMADAFGWANKTPSQPSLEFLRRHIERFLDVWAKTRRGGGPGSIEQLLAEGRVKEAAALMRKR